MMRVADYIFKYLADHGVAHVFTVVGGASMYLNDALRKEKRIKYVCMHHEQACSFAAEGYARATGKLAVVLVTGGPGVTNCMTGVFGQYTDSVPVLYISGNVKKSTLSINAVGLRQLGDQELYPFGQIGCTKYLTRIMFSEETEYKISKAIDFAMAGRKGPVWIDVPLDVQNMQIDGLMNPRPKLENPIFKCKDFFKEFNDLYKAKKPLIVAGHGIRLGNAIEEFNRLMNNFDIPVVTTFNGMDLVPSDHPNYIGRIGTIGTRAGNFALQNADCILFLGTRNNIRQVSYNWEKFAPNATKIVVDIDSAELDKPTLKPDVKVNCDVKDFLIELNENLAYIGISEDWMKWCREQKEKYPIELDQKEDEGINPYLFIKELTSKLPEESVIVSANGTASIALFQAGVIKKGTRVIMNSGCASMGYALPAAIGACFATGKEVICIEGDGSLQMNIQELATIEHYQLSIKIFVLNNGGYKSLQITQKNHFGEFIGCDQNDLSFPSLYYISEAYDFIYSYQPRRIEHFGKYPEIIDVALGNYEFAPKLASIKMEDGTIQSPSLENMSPFLEGKKKK